MLLLIPRYPSILPQELSGKIVLEGRGFKPSSFGKYSHQLPVTSHQ
ncbi:hypothetical protein CKA32_003828 [Geitlerinema sp. FC II]|nr:hypothetical protein CKA32_003828 [Geitlerinema sp. FC II]